MLVEVVAGKKAEGKVFKPEEEFKHVQLILLVLSLI
jgi:hypothetical protein